MENEIKCNVEIHVVNLPEITKNIEILKQLSKLSSNDAFFENDIIECMLQDKWNRYG